MNWHLYPLSTQIGYSCVLWRKGISYSVKPVRHWTVASGGVTCNKFIHKTFGPRLKHLNIKFE